MQVSDIKQYIEGKWYVYETGKDDSSCHYIFEKPNLWYYHGIDLQSRRKGNFEIKSENNIQFLEGMNKGKLEICAISQNYFLLKGMTEFYVLVRSVLSCPQCEACHSF
jgi:hypothetical protein